MPAPRATRTLYGRPGPILGRTEGRRGVPATGSVRATDLADLHDEIHAAGQEMRAAGITLQYADRVGRRDLVLHTAGQLVVRGEGYMKRGDA